MRESLGKFPGDKPRNNNMNGVTVFKASDCDRIEGNNIIFFIAPFCVSIKNSTNRQQFHSLQNEDFNNIKV